MPAVDYKAALGNPTSIDHANIEIQGMRVSRTVKMGLFTVNKNAVRQGDYILAKESYPVARVRFPANRNIFRLQPGDPFKFVYPKYGITEMICRVVRIEEEDVGTERIIVTALEESVHATKPITSYTEPPNYRRRRPSDRVSVLTPVNVVEAPYALAGEEISLIFLVPRKTGNELGYQIYLSQDGTEYYNLKNSAYFQVWGTLAEAYPVTPTIDEDTGMLINFDTKQDMDRLQSISYTELLGTRNTCIIGDEIITFQTITPITTTQYRLTGVYRGRWGTVNKSHAIGENFYFTGASIVPVKHYSFTTGSTRYFKVVPYSRSSSGSLSSAEEITHTFTGEAYTPYEVINLKANGDNYWPIYYGLPTPGDIVLTWTGRVRGDGTGIGDPSVVVDGAHETEGSFRAKFYVGGSLVRTADDLSSETYTYTAANILADNGHYPSKITAKVSNFIVGAGSVEYESDTTDLLIRKSGTLTTTTTTTSTTSTSTTSTTTTTTTTTTTV